MTLVLEPWALAGISFCLGMAVAAIALGIAGMWLQ
jgi:hypothetical protein